MIETTASNGITKQSVSIYTVGFIMHPSKYLTTHADTQYPYSSMIAYRDSSLLEKHRVNPLSAGSIRMAGKFLKEQLRVEYEVKGCQINNLSAKHARDHISSQFQA